MQTTLLRLVPEPQNIASEAPPTSQTVNAETSPASNKIIRFLVKQTFWRTDLKKLNSDFKNSSVDAHVVRGGRVNSFTHNIFLVTRTNEKEKAVKFFQDWYKENQPPLPKLTSSEDGEEKTEVKPRPEPVFIELTEPKTRKAKSSSAKANGSKANGSKASSAEAVSEGNEPSKEAGDKPTIEEAKNGSDKTNKEKNTRRQTKAKNPRSPPRRVEQPGRVVVKVPGETSVDEVKSFLTDFPSVEVSMKHLKERTIRRRSRMEVLAGYTLALIDVGDENRQKAIDALTGKELRGQTLQPKPGRGIVRDQNGAEEKNEPPVESDVHVENADTQ